MEFCEIRLRYVFKGFPSTMAKLRYADQLLSRHAQVLQIEACSAISTLARSCAFEVRV